MEKVRIFISYAHEDQSRVEGLYQCLVGAGFAPWLDREHIIPGMRWQSMIKKALKESDFVLVCLSASSINKRGFLQREIKQALEQAEEKLEHDVYLIPARLDDCEVPDALSDIQWVDLFENDGCQRLLKAIKYGLKQSGKTMPSPVSSSRRWWRLFIGVGGALMLVTLVGWLYIPPSGQRPLDEQTVASPSPKTEMVNPTPSATPITTPTGIQIPVPSPTLPNQTPQIVTTISKAEVEKAMSRANKYLDQAKYDLAIAECDRVLRYEPRNQKARNLKAKAISWRDHFRQ